MERLYTIRYSKLCFQTIGYDKEHDFRAFKLQNVRVYGSLMDMFFCRDDNNKIFVVAGTFRRTGPRRGADHRYHSGESYYDIYFRKNFKSSQEGNEFYKIIKRTMEVKQ